MLVCLYSVVMYEVPEPAVHNRAIEGGSLFHYLLFGVMRRS
jgi:hypothetical protein